MQLRFLHDITVRPTDSLPGSLEGPLTFRGYCAPSDLASAKDKVVMCFNTKRRGLPSSSQRVVAAEQAGAAGLVLVDDPYFKIEPPRWPAPYARAVSLGGDAPPVAASLPVMIMSSEAFARIVGDSGRSPEKILELGGAMQPLPAFDLPDHFRARFAVTRRDYWAKNVLAVLPGYDPELRSQHLVLSAHLDGFGYGEPVNGDAIYNGTLDDAAYVATLIRFATLHRGSPLKRNVLIAIFAGEEKGLLGSRWFVGHPTVPRGSIVGDINLDMLRPLFPLEVLTELAVNESSLGTDARRVASTMDIRIRADAEPERTLLQRADHWPFMRAGIPATGFIFGYEPGTEAERRYRNWYQVRYHRPQDDLSQPVDFKAAKKFNDFFYRFAATVADEAKKPTWAVGSSYSAPQ
jgi:hypothetical protein